LKIDSYNTAVTEAIETCDNALEQAGHRLVLVLVWNAQTDRFALSFTPNLTPETKHDAMLRAQKLLAEYIKGEAI
jgi:hypothetical protein